MGKRSLKRREFLVLSGAAAVGAAAAACQPQVVEKVVEKPVEVTKVVEKEKLVEKPVEVTKVVEKEKIVEKPPEKFHESPKLAELVKAGKLPPVEQRLPKSPVVVGGRPEIGKYGGEVRMIHMDPESFVENYDWFAERMLKYSDHDLRTIVPNVFESWETQQDGKVYTFKLREGMKWSDGQPVTTEDVAFWWEDHATNTEISPVVGWQFRHGGAVMKLEVLDKYTFKVTFAAPFGNFPAYLTRWHQGTFLIPKHYMKKYHAKYRDKAELEAEVKKEKFETWVQLYNAKNSGNSVWNLKPNSKEYPMLSGWVVVDIPQPGLGILERNPYYWKVDQAGNQLPYIERLRIDLTIKTEIVTQKIIQGELDWVGMHSVTIARYPLYKENEPKQNYIVADYLSTMTDRYTLYPNHTHVDPVMNEIINHPNFVKALSVAINREEINQSLFFGLARMGQLGPMPGSKYYEEEFGKAWAQYDKALANKLLDEMGLNKKDGDGFRLRPDGKRLKFNIEHSGIRVGAAAHEFSEMAVSFWREVGIDATTKEIQISLYDQRWQSGEIDCGFWHADRCTDMLLPIEMRWYIPTERGQGGPGPLWGWWYSSGGKSGQKPPQRILDYYDLYIEMNTVVDEEKRVAAGKKIFRSLAKDPLAIGSVLESPAPLIINKKLRNMPRPKALVGWDSYGISTYHPEAFFYGS